MIDYSGHQYSPKYSVRMEPDSRVLDPAISSEIAARRTAPLIRVHLRYRRCISVQYFLWMYPLLDCCPGCYKPAMTREQIIARLRENEAALRARGVTHAALFGSRARGEAREDSDTDIMIEIDPEARLRPSVLADAMWAC